MLPTPSWETQHRGRGRSLSSASLATRVAPRRVSNVPGRSADADVRRSWSKGHGYVQSESTGWTAFYRDLMTGRVREGDEYKGISPEAWTRYPTPRRRALNSG